MNQNETLVSGFLVDTVNEMLDITPCSIEPPPKQKTYTEQEFLKGIGKAKEEVVVILDVDKVFSSLGTAKIDAL